MCLHMFRIRLDCGDETFDLGYESIREFLDDPVLPDLFGTCRCCASLLVGDLILARGIRKLRRLRQAVADNATVIVRGVL